MSITFVCTKGRRSTPPNVKVLLVSIRKVGGTAHVCGAASTSVDPSTRERVGRERAWHIITLSPLQQLSNVCGIVTGQ